MARRPLVAGNWKMNGLGTSAARLDKIIAGAATLPATVDLLVCPPFTLIASFAARAHGTRVAIGGQDCHAQASGAHTGDISAEMLADAHASAVIVGHSERRSGHHETDADVRAKAMAARRAGLLAIICVGETRTERDTGKAGDVVRAQLAGSLPDGNADFVIAYEPVWAIGSGQTPTVSDVARHAWPDPRRTRCVFGPRRQRRSASFMAVRSRPPTPRSLLTIDNVDGALVGGASLHADEFLAIAGVYR